MPYQGRHRSAVTLRERLRSRARSATSGTLVFALVAALVTLGWAQPSGAVTTSDRNVVAGHAFYLDPNTTAAAHARTEYAARVIASVAQARWVTSSTPTSAVRASVNAYVTAAARRNQTAALVVYAIPGRDCGSYSAGGLSGPAAYAQFVEQFTEGIGARRAIVIIEPDALASIGCLSAAGQRQRLAMISGAVATLSRLPLVATYLDAGNSRWLSVGVAAARLRAAGVARARGFSLNVSNFFSTAEEQAYGEKLSAALGGKHYVVDTSRNGRGPAPMTPTSWCNPAGRATGARPTTITHAAHDDANLWVKHPGESDGPCHPGDPASGRWFASYAAGLIARS